MSVWVRVRITVTVRVRIIFMEFYLSLNKGPHFHWTAGQVSIGQLSYIRFSHYVKGWELFISNV